MRVYHCEQLMTTTRIPLISGRIQYDHRCGSCGYEEREIYTPTGKPLMWKNMTLHRKLAAGESQGV